MITADAWMTWGGIERRWYFSKLCQPASSRLQVLFVSVWMHSAQVDVCLWPCALSRGHLSNDDCVEDKMEDCQNHSVLYCVRQLYTVIHTHTHTRAVLKVDWCFRFRCSLDLGLLFVFFPFCSCVICFCCVRFSIFSIKPGKNVSYFVCLTYVFVDHRLHHGAVPCWLQWPWWARWPSAETRSDVVSPAEDLWRFHCCFRFLLNLQKNA